jgi:methionyl-tRNA synthetase
MIGQVSAETSIRHLVSEHEKECISAAEDSLSREYWDHLRFNLILERIWDIIRASNNHIAKTEPWKLAKNDNDAVRDILFGIWNALRLSAVLLYPFMPDTAEKLWKQLGLSSLTKEAKESVAHAPLDKGYPGVFYWGWKPDYPVKVSKGEQLFPRIDKKKEEQGMIDNEPAKEKPATDTLISIDDVMKVELRIAKVVSAERVKKSEKLLKLQVDTGETRQIVAGIGKAYSPEDLIGKKIVIVTNLQPAKLMGQESNGMLLAATGSDGLPVILVPEKDVEEGSSIK